MEIARYLIFNLASIINKNQVDIPKQDLNASTTESVLKVVFGIAGGIALIVIALGGLRYINSLGNAQNVAKAKDTILYALIGLVVCILGYAIVGFVIQRTSP